jgi:hypothetical protein
MPRILDEASLAVTLRNLEDARLQGMRASARAVHEALDWIVGRHAEEGAARSTLFAPTEADLRDSAALPTAEYCFGGGHSAYVVAFEAARALALWGRTGDWPVEETFAGIRDKWRQHAPRIGYYCCPPCSVARWRALTAGRPVGWERAVAEGLRRLAETPLLGDGQWGGKALARYPFCYTLLALSELPPEEVEAERRRVRPAAEAMLRALAGDDVATRLRRRALEWGAIHR